MKLIFSLLLITTIAACQTKPKEKKEETTDELITRLDRTRMVDSLVKEETLLAASRGSEKSKDCPVKILKATVTHNSIGTPQASISFKNTSTKVVDGIKVAILCYNNFDDPVTDYSGMNRSNGLMQDIVRPGKTSYNTWTLYSFETTSKIKPFVYEIHFKDGTKWTTD